MEKENVKHCIVVEENICDNCGFCDLCEYDSSKVCDNCMKCLGFDDADYNGILIDNLQDYNSYRSKNKKQ